MPSMIAKEMVDSSCEDAPVIVVSIAAIADQADLSPASLTGSLTVNGVAAIPDAWAWRVNGATTGIGDATDPTTVFIPTTGGTYVATLAASIYGEWRYAEQEAFVVGSGLLTLSIDAISDQSTLNPISFNSTASGGVGTKTYSWLVNGSTSGLSSATAADPTFTPTVAGEHTAVCTITDEAGQTKTTTRSFTIGTGALSVSIAAVSDQLGLTAATLDSTVSNAVGSVTYAWTVDDATTGLSSSTAADPTYTPTTAGKHTAVVTVTDDAGQTAKATVTWTVGDADGFLTDLDIDFRQAVTLTVDGAYTIDGVSVTMANLSAAATKECSVANGLYLVHDGTGTPDPQAQINLKTLLTNVGHTFDPAAYEYRISWQWEPDTSNVGFGTVVALNDGAGGAAGERFFVGSSRTNNMMTGGEGTWKDDWAITPQSSMSILVHGHDFDVRYGTKSVDTWDGNTSGMTRFGDTQRSFNARAHLVTTATVTTWDTSALTLIFKVTEATGTGKLYRLWVAHRSRQ